MATACLSEVADSAWAAAARIEGSGCFAKSATSKTSRCVAQSKQSFHRAGPYLHTGIARESPQQWVIFANLPAAQDSWLLPPAHVRFRPLGHG